MKCPEQWLLVDGYPNYMVSSLGRIKNIKTKKYLKGIVVTNGYIQVRFYRKGLSSGRLYLLQRVVLQAFRGAPPMGYEAAHLNGKRNDNRLSNLKWVSHIENESHKEIHKTRYRGELHPGSKLNIRLVWLIRDYLKRGLTQREVAQRLGLTRSAVESVALKRTWSHVK